MILQKEKQEDEVLNFDLDVYEGPLDVLLQLAKSSQIEISDISLNLIIDQYLVFIEKLEKMEINLASSYLEMAAELLKIKSAFLIGQNTYEEDLIEDFEALGFSREELIKKLLEYQKYKEVATKFLKLSEIKSHSFYKEPDKMKEYRQNNFANHLSVDDLFSSYNIVMKKAFFREKTTEKTIEIRELFVEEKINYFKQLKEEIVFSFLTKTEPIEGKLSFFLGLLEAMKLQVVWVSIENGEILIKPNGEINE